jgi:hypothetical protein
MSMKLAHLLHIPKVPGLNLAPKTNYSQLFLSFHCHVKENGGTAVRNATTLPHPTLHLLFSTI